MGVEIIWDIASLVLSAGHSQLQRTLLFLFLGPQNCQPRPMTLGERKRIGPRVLVNKLNINKDVIDRLRRITKACGKLQAATDKAKSQTAENAEANGMKATENQQEVINGSSSDNEPKKRLKEDVNGIKKSPDKDSTQRTPMGEDKSGFTKSPDKDSIQSKLKDV